MPLQKLYMTLFAVCIALILALVFIAISLYGLFMCLGYMPLSSTANTVFNWLQDLVSITTLTNWITILVTYLRFYYGSKKQGISPKSLPWATPLQPYISWASLFMLTILLITSGYLISSKDIGRTKNLSHILIFLFSSSSILGTSLFERQRSCHWKISPFNPLSILPIGIMSLRQSQSQRKVFAG